MNTHATLETSQVSSLMAFMNGRGRDAYRELMAANGSDMGESQTVGKGRPNWQREEQINIEVEETKLWLADGLTVQECADRHGIARVTEDSRLHSRGLTARMFKKRAENSP